MGGTDPDAVEEALSALLPGRSDDLVGDLLAAAREALARRQANSCHGGAVLAALREQGGVVEVDRGTDRHP